MKNLKITFQDKVIENTPEIKEWVSNILENQFYDQLDGFRTHFIELGYSENEISLSLEVEKCSFKEDRIITTSWRRSGVRVKAFTQDSEKEAAESFPDCFFTSSSFLKEDNKKGQKVKALLFEELEKSNKKYEADKQAKEQYEELVAVKKELAAVKKENRRLKEKVEKLTPVQYSTEYVYHKNRGRNIIKWDVERFIEDSNYQSSEFFPFGDRALERWIDVKNDNEEVIVVEANGTFFIYS